MALRAVRAVDRWQQARGLTAVPYAVIKKAGEDRAGSLAAVVAYYSFLSLFPLLLVLVTVVAIAVDGNPELRMQLLDTAFSQFPVVGEQLRSNVSAASGSGVAIAIGVVVSAWAGMGAIISMQDALNTLWRVRVQRRPGFVSLRLRSLGGLGLLAGVIVIAVALSGVAAAGSSFGSVARIAVAILALAVNIALFALAFRLLTVHRTSWRAVLPGAAMAGIGWSILQSIGAVYVDHVVAGASQTYGSFAVVLGLLAYLYLLSQLALYAAELNTVLADHLWPRSLVAEDVVAADVRSTLQLMTVEDRLTQPEVAEVDRPHHAATG